jgi:hypothetical protein
MSDNQFFDKGIDNEIDERIKQEHWREFTESFLTWWNIKNTPLSDKEIIEAVAYSDASVKYSIGSVYFSWNVSYNQRRGKYNFFDQNLIDF